MEEDYNSKVTETDFPYCDINGDCELGDNAISQRKYEYAINHYIDALEKFMEIGDSQDLDALKLYIKAFQGIYNVATTIKSDLSLKIFNLAKEFQRDADENTEGTYRFQEYAEQALQVKEALKSKARQYDQLQFLNSNISHIFMFVLGLAVFILMYFYKD